MIFSFPKGEKKELIEKKLKKTAVFSSERKTISQSHMHVGKEDERERKEEEERKELLPLFFVMSGGVRTRGQKRRIGQRDVWDLIVNNDDICFKHILPRLNRTDVKFLYGVNTETRKLIKRSSRAGDLKRKFKVKEMSSISTLEVAWEHYPWGMFRRTTKHISAGKLLKRINSSYSSGRERRKSVIGLWDD